VDQDLIVVTSGKFSRLCINRYGRLVRQSEPEVNEIDEDVEWAKTEVIGEPPRISWHESATTRGLDGSTIVIYRRGKPLSAAEVRDRVEQPCRGRTALRKHIDGDNTWWDVVVAFEPPKPRSAKATA
jgi:hypothetical protein